MNIVNNAEILHQLTDLRLDNSLSIKKAYRKMVDEKSFTALVTEGEDVLAELSIKDLREAMDQGYDSDKTLYELILTKMLENVFNQVEDKE
jgi:hypothetical protein